MLFVVTIFIALVLMLCVWAVGRYWEPLLAVGCFQGEQRLLTWAAKGIAVPLLLWTGFNFALTPGSVATMPRVVLANAKADVWTRIVLELSIPAAPLVASCWAAMTLAWLMVRLATQTDCRKEILGAGIFCGVLLSPVIGVILFLFGWAGIGVALLTLLTPILRDLLVLGTPKLLPPAYERAMERLQRGEPSAAEREIIRQLERREDDFKGWMLLAEIYANHFGDLPEAERTVRELCRQPNLTRAEFSEALMQLGAWHLAVGRDAVSARRVWSEICETFPHTEFADAARRCINRRTAEPEAYRAM